jgi:hypothetical protein
MDDSHTSEGDDHNTASNVQRRADAPVHPAPTQSSSSPHLNPRSCVTCRRRKVKCNKEDPCRNCLRAGTECIFPGPGRAPRRSRKLPDTELLARLRKLEGVVQSLGAQTDDHAVASAHPSDATKFQPQTSQYTNGRSPILVPSDSPMDVSDKPVGRLLVNDDRSRYVSNGFWTAMSDEVRHHTRL